MGAGLLLGFVVGQELGFEPIVGMAVGTLLGGVVQYACQIPSLRRTGLRFRPDFNPADPGVRQVLRLMGPAAIGAAAVQVNVMVNSVFASRVTDAAGEIIDGPVSWLVYAFRFMQLPLGLFGIAVASATLPVISREAGAGRIDDFRETLSRSLGLVFLLTIPSSVGLFVLSRPLGALSMSAVSSRPSIPTRRPSPCRSIAWAWSAMPPRRCWHPRSMPWMTCASRWLCP